MTQDFLLELGCEDLPARYVLPLAEALLQGIVGGLSRRGVQMDKAQLLATPRRLAVLVAAVAAEQPEQSVEFTGPAMNVALKDGAPTPAALGFAKKCGVEFAQLGEKDGKLHFARRLPGKATAALIPEIFEETLKAMDELVPKRMRWAEGSETFVRPVSWIVCLLGGEVVPLKRFGLEAGRITYGHRFHAPDAIRLASPSTYAPALKAAKVWADVGSRKAEIRRQIEAKAAALKGYARISDELLEEVTALVEWPVVIAGQMEQRFTDELPREVIVATVETNQRYFTVFADATLTTITPHFITIANIESKDPAQVIEGNERVVRPRLTDALFFWQQDKKQPLAAYAEKLATATYQKDLGSQGARVERVKTLAVQLATAAGADAAVVAEAAALCKCDLVTKMVFEFPELQGIMGGYYATGVGNRLPSGVGLAIREHYQPTQAGTPIPSSREGQVLALADKLDALAGIFAIGQKPTASKDPFALRRAANGVLRICAEASLPLDLNDVLSQALALQPAGKRDAATLGDLLAFVQERQRAAALAAGAAAESVEAVRALGITQPHDFQLRLQAVEQFRALADAANLAAAHKRVRNLLKQAGPDAAAKAIDPQHFEDPSEAALHTAMGDVAGRNAAEPDYTQKLRNLATLRAPVDAFFTAVMVNAEHPAVRANRYALLAELDGMCREVADISYLPG